MIKGSVLMSLPIIKRFWRTAHAPCHVTQGRGSQITTYLESPTPYCLFTLQLSGREIAEIRRFWVTEYLVLGY